MAVQVLLVAEGLFIAEPDLKLVLVRVEPFEPELAMRVVFLHIPAVIPPMS